MSDREKPELAVSAKIGEASGPAEASTGAAQQRASAPGAVAVGVQPLSSAAAPPWQAVWNKLRINRTAMAGLCLLTLLYTGAILAGFLAPYSYETQHDTLGFHPPMLTRVRIRNSEGRLVRPFIYGIRVIGIRQYEEDRSATYPLHFLARGDSYHILGLVKTDLHLFSVETPGLVYLFGSDRFGRDIFSRIMYGSQISLSVGLVGILISTAIGMLVGGFSGYFGGVADFVSMRVVELILAIPSLYLILVLKNSFSEKLSSGESYLLIVAILALVGWASEARVIRGMVLSLKEAEFVLAARALGLSNPRIVIRHILPNTLSFVIVTATLGVPFYILGEVALSFLGVGIQEPEASWGNMLRDAELSIDHLTEFTWILIPGIFILIAVMAWNFVGDGLRDAADPRALS